jgi:hypothetical protein
MISLGHRDAPVSALHSGEEAIPLRTARMPQKSQVQILSVQRTKSQGDMACVSIISQT